MLSSLMTPLGPGALAAYIAKKHIQKRRKQQNVPDYFDEVDWNVLLKNKEARQNERYIPPPNNPQPKPQPQPKAIKPSAHYKRKVMLDKLSAGMMFDPYMLDAITTPETPPEPNKKRRRVRKEQ